MKEWGITQPEKGQAVTLFEFEEGRLIPAQFGHPVASGITNDVVDAMCSQVLEIVSRPLFPITWRDIVRTQNDVEDQPRLIALDATGQVVSVEVVLRLDSETLIDSLSRLADAAALSWSDLARAYEGGIDAFKAGWMAFRDSMPPSPGVGPRLVMVVGSIDPQVRPALDVLSASGVEVHEVSLRRMSNGRTFLEVSAVGPRMYGHAPQLLPAQENAVQEITSRAHQPAASIESAPVAAPAPSAPYAAPAAVPTAQPAPQPAMPSEAVPESAAPAAAAYSMPVSNEVREARTKGIPLLAQDDEGLAALAQLIGDDVPLAAHPNCHAPEPLILGRDGFIRSTTRVWASLALLEQSVPGLTPAWQRLRISDLRGPTLAESIAEVNEEIKREYAQSAPHSYGAPRY